MNPAADPPTVILVLMTFPSEEEASHVAAALVDEHLVACVNLIPDVRSFFIWEGARQDAEEVLAVAKTTSDRLDAVVARVKALHSYSVPEIIGVPLLGGSSDYLAWVRQSVK